MIGLTTLELFNYTFNITEQNNNFDFYINHSDEFSFVNLKDELEYIINVSDKLPEDIKDVVGPPNIDAYRKL